MGRPSAYTDEIADQICEQLAEGCSLVQISKRDEMPGLRTITQWIGANEAFQLKYIRAREQQAEHFAQEIIDIADDSAGGDSASVNAARLRVDARKWVAAKLLPKKYGDRTELVGAGGKDLIPPEVDPSKVALAILNILNAKGVVEGKE